MASSEEPLITANQLYLPQRQIANCLELAYITACRDNEVAGKVRQTSHDARTEHLMALGMMQKLKVTSKHIIDTLIPYIKLGVDRKDPKLIQAAITMTIEYVKEMDKKSSETVESYNEFQSKILEMQLYLEGRTEDITDATKKLQNEIERQKKLLDEAIQFKEENERQKNALTADMDSMKIKHESSMKSAEKTFDKGISHAKYPNWLDGLIGGGVLITAFALGPGEDKKAALADATQIRTATKYASRLGGQFTTMQLFWQKMSAAYEKMEKRIKANELVLHDAELGIFITNSCEQALTEWKIILDICTKYEQESSLALKENYNFMAVQFATMPEDVKGRRKEALKSSITSADNDLN